MCLYGASIHRQAGRSMREFRASVATAEVIPAVNLQVGRRHRLCDAVCVRPSTGKFKSRKQGKQHKMLTHCEEIEEFRRYLPSEEKLASPAT